MDNETKRQLRIKTNVLKRCLKEYAMYEKEVKQDQKNLANMDVNHDRYNQLQQVLEESKCMINDASNRIQMAIEDLESFHKTEQIEAQYKGDEIFLEGIKYIKEAAYIKQH